MDGQKIVQNTDVLRAAGGTYRDLCDIVSQFFWPEDEFLTETSDGSEILQPIDSFAIESLTSLINGLTSNTMSMDKGNIIDADNELMKLPIVKDWYGMLSSRTEHHMEQTQFGVFFQKWLHEYCAYGGAVMYIRFNDATNEHEYMIYSIKHTFYTFDAGGNINAVFRDYEYTASQAVERFGYDVLNVKIQKAYDDDDLMTKFNFIHAFYERKDRDETKIDAANMRYASEHIFRDDGTKVMESGSRQFRYVIKHFYQKNGGLNGRSPCMQALPAARSLMKVNADHYDGVENGILPPTWFPDRNAAETAVLESGAVDYCDMSKGKPWSMVPDLRALSFSETTIMRLQSQIENLLFVPLFRTLMDRGSPEMTAFQTAALDSERVQALAPIANTLSGFFEMAIKVVALDLVYHDQVDGPPADIDEDKITVKYTSRLDVRLSQVETSAVQQAVAATTEINTMLDQSPATDAIYNRVELGIAIAESHGVPPKLTRNLDEANDYLASVQQATAHQQQAEQMASMIKPIDTQAPAAEGSPLSSIENMADV